MNIIYNKNPLYIKVELDPFDQKELWYKIKIQELEELLSNANFHLQEDKYLDIQRAQEYSNPNYYCTDSKSKLDERCDMLLDRYIQELKSSHIGDCTCIPCSCLKCHAESLLGINTLQGLGSHSAYKIQEAFGKKNEKTTFEAIDYLANYEPKATWAGWEKFAPRWKSEADLAHAWLVEYTNKHFN